jgi:hypothetical protein
MNASSTALAIGLFRNEPDVRARRECNTGEVGEDKKVCLAAG